jgi:hypothetical protein
MIASVGIVGPTTEAQPALNTDCRTVPDGTDGASRTKEVLVLYGIVYTPRSSSGAVESSLQPFTSWRLPLEFEVTWSFAAGGGMGLIESASSGTLEKAIAPYKPFFDFRVEQVGSGGELSRSRDTAIAPAGLAT